MKRVTGIGGVFFHARASCRLCKPGTAKHLGIDRAGVKVELWQPPEGQ